MIAFAPGYPASALAIGSTLRLIDGLGPGMAVDPASGSFCVLMPCRFTNAVAEDPVEVGVGQAAQATATAPAIAA